MSVMIPIRTANNIKQNIAFEGSVLKVDNRKQLRVTGQQQTVSTDSNKDYFK